MRIHEPVTINKLTVANRIIMPPMATAKADNGFVTPECVEYYENKSRGGYLGLIIIEHAYVNRQGMAKEGQLSLSRDSDIAGFKQIAEAIHGNKTKVLAQISHAGSASNPETTGMPAISASAVMNEGLTGRNNILPEAMSQNQINALISDFASAASRVKKAGLDGVEIHSAHGYLLNQFYSPLTNRRTDAYTYKTMEGRLQLLTEIIQAVRETVGQDFLVAVRLGGCDYMEGGSTIEDSVEAAVRLEKAGIDLLDISGGFNGYIRRDVKIPGYFSDMTAEIKKNVSLPVILTGGVTDIQDAERLIQEEKADLIGVGRAILKDSDWAKNSIY